MTKEQSLQMFGVPDIDAWLDYISNTSAFVLGGKTHTAISLLSDLQEEISLGNNVNTDINRIKYLLDLSPREELERRTVAKLMHYLESKGFEVVGVIDEEEHYSTNDPTITIGHIFAAEEASLRVRSQIGNHGREHGILLIPGNSGDIVFDWTYSENDEDGFNKAMEEFILPED
ncbi:MAG: hypothetical protein ACYCZR_03925 [Burkholderiales bacterium]